MESSVEIVETTPKVKEKLSENVIWLLMYILSIIHGLMVIVPGMLSSCIVEMKEEFGLTDKQFGLFGSVNGFGSFIGSLAFTLVIEKISHKCLISTMLLINCICHFAFFFKLSYPILLASRFICGFVCVFCFIYFPMWVEKFAMKKWVNFMQTFVQVSNTIGHIFGYFVYLILGGHNWKYGFLLESISISSCVFVMLVIPFKYYDKNYINPDYVKDANDVNPNDNSEDKETKEIKEKREPQKEEEETIMKDIICNLPYVLISLYRGNRLFIFVAINFWYSDYLQNSLMEKNPNAIFWSYSITMVIASLIGNILGGVVINRIGGTKSKHSYVAMGVLQFLCVLFGLFAPFTNSVLIFTILMSMYILINSASGIITISASFAVMPKTLTGTATGFYSLLVNLIAFLPAPYAYAFIKSLVGEGSYIMVVLMLYGLFGCFEIMAADIYMRVKKIFIYKQEFKSVSVKL
jgi:predicted MFS family arabinose efflux permease